jgi:hypothetical protein
MSLGVKLHSCLKRVFGFLALYFLLTSPLFADSSSISSKEASYDGNALVLKGSVLLNHALGMMRAENARLVKEDKHHPFSLIYLNEDVAIQLNNHAEISCNRAEFDFQNQVGLLLPSPGEKISFTSQFIDKSGERVPVMLQSIRANLTFSEGQSDEMHICQMHANEEVVIEYGDGYLLKAGSALYQAEEPMSYILAFPAEEEGTCHFSYKGDEIEAQKVRFQPQESLVILSQPNGVVKTLFAPNEIAFSAGEMAWNRAQGTVAFFRNIHIADSSLGEIYCDEKIELVASSSAHSLYDIRAEGKTTIHTFAPNRQTVTCFGLLSFDQKTLTSTFESPLVDGVVPEGQQIDYRGENFQLLASSGVLEYGWMAGHLRPTKLSLQGGVRLASCPGAESKQCALGSHLTYSLLDHTMTLSAKKGEKVLYWDETQGITLSANQVRVHKDPFTGKESVKGIGNVRFSFSSTENALLKKMFPFYQPTGEL